MAGRDISVTHEALGTVRVMKTCGMMGEVVGKAASVCLRHDCSPRDVYERYLDELKVLMRMPGTARRGNFADEVKIPPGAPPPPAPVQDAGQGIDPATLGGIVIDDTQAKFTGEWQSG